MLGSGIVTNAILKQMTGRVESVRAKPAILILARKPSFRHSLPRSGIAGGLPESSAMEGNP